MRNPISEGVLAGGAFGAVVFLIVGLGSGRPIMIAWGVLLAILVGLGLWLNKEN
jgi:hypothetical protein